MNNFFIIKQSNECKIDALVTNLSQCHMWTEIYTILLSYINTTWAHQGSYTKPIPLIQCKQLWACILGASLSWPKSFAANNNSVHCKVFMYLSGNCVIVNALKTEADFPAWNYLGGCQFSRTHKVSPTFGFRLHISQFISTMSDSVCLSTHNSMTINAFQVKEKSFFDMQDFLPFFQGSKFGSNNHDIVLVEGVWTYLLRGAAVTNNNIMKLTQLPSTLQSLHKKHKICCTISTGKSSNCELVYVCPSWSYDIHSLSE